MWLIYMKQISKLIRPWCSENDVSINLLNVLKTNEIKKKIFKDYTIYTIHCAHQYNKYTNSIVFFLVHILPVSKID